MEDTSKYSNKLSDKEIENLEKINQSRQNKSKQWSRFSYNELVNLKKLTLVYEGKGGYGYDDIEYYVELIDTPTKYNMQWKSAHDVRWWSHTRNDDRKFLLELGDKSSIKEINKKLYDEGFKVKEITKI